MKSECWKMTSMECVQDVMQMENLSVMEVDVVTALVKWGRQQVLLDQGDPFDGNQLRAKIDSCLQFVRFSALSQTEFIQLCKFYLDKVLTDSEKYQVLMCIALGKWDQMPDQFQNSIREARIGQPLAFALPYLRCSNTCVSTQEELAFNLVFEVSRRVSILGVRILPEDSADGAIVADNFIKMCITLYYNEYNGLLGIATNKTKTTFNGEEYLRIASKCVLDPGVKYRINFSYPSLHLHDTFYPYALQSYSVTKGGVTIKFFNSSICANVRELLFELV